MTTERLYRTQAARFSVADRRVREARLLRDRAKELYAVADDLIEEALDRIAEARRLMDRAEADR